ncbi:conserved hypothetical protein [Sporisorium reilianum SRZ2]|uniref:Zn(2)-C6 fungal-type domain-containing protein n=1 Tax=Sporisorium reilianum (strain SRZ2) TaxID=999809 RepID=E6ZY95_SPORE|nr:conserved hypothetical protein [Sporisorium reilianum SRZ2]
MTTSARRQLFRRSKAGCWNCRSKKKKCDELRPHCTRCVRAGEGCRYPDASSESLTESNGPISPIDYASPSISSSSSFPSNMSMHASPMLSRSSSTSGYSSQHLSRRAQHPSYHHHPYASSTEHHVPPSHAHRDYHAQRPLSHQPPTSPAAAAPHPPPYYAAAHSTPHAQLPQQQFPPPPLSASAAADWDREQHVFKRARYDDFSSSSSTSSTLAYQDARSRQPYDAHHRIPSNHSQTSSKGKGRDALPSISPHQPNSFAMAPSASLASISNVSPPSHRSMPSPTAASRSADTSPINRTSPIGIHSHRHAPVAAAAHDRLEIDSRGPASTALPANHTSASVSSRADGSEAHYDAPPSPSPRPSSSSSQSRHKLVFDYASTEPDPEQLLATIESFPRSVVAQQTNGARAYFELLRGIAGLGQGQAMAHALAAVVASQRSSSDANMDAAAAPDSTADRSVASMVELANRHHLSAIKALQTQHQPSRRRRFSIIESNPNNLADDLPPGSNAATMILLIFARSSIGKSLMLPSYFNQCEQFLADAVEHVSTHRLFPSVNGEAIVGTPEDPPALQADKLTHHGGLLFLGTVAGLYECYLSQYTAITDWDYNPARLKRLLPFNWNESDAAIFDKTRNGVAETVYSVSMVTLELVIETLDTMRKLRRAEAAAYGNRKSSRSEAEDGTAALNSLALREELGLVIRDLETGAFWKGAARTLSEAEQLSVLNSIDAQTAEQSAADENADAQRTDAGDDGSNGPVTKAFKSGSLFLAWSADGEQKQVVNRLRLANHLYRNALLVDLYVTVFNRPPSSLAVREIVSRSIGLLAAVPDKLEHGLAWPAIVLGSYARDEPERNQVRSFVSRAQWKGLAGASAAVDVLERVWSDESDSWRESVTYFGSPLIS